MTFSFNIGYIDYVYSKKSQNVCRETQGFISLIKATYSIELCSAEEKSKLLKHSRAKKGEKPLKTRAINNINNKSITVVGRISYVCCVFV